MAIVSLLALPLPVLDFAPQAQHTSCRHGYQTLRWLFHNAGSSWNCRTTSKAQRRGCYLATMAPKMQSKLLSNQKLSCQVMHC